MGRTLPLCTQYSLACCQDSKLSWFALCGQESFLTYNQDKNKHCSGVRPCPFCRQFFTKEPGTCNHVTCDNCKEKWNFVSGKKDPKGEFDLYDPGPRTYRLKGDYNQLTDKLYTDDYIDGISPEVDLHPIKASE